MEESCKYIVKEQRRYNIAYYSFLAAIGLLYIVNIVICVTVYQDNLFELLRDFGLPVIVTTVLYAVDQSKSCLVKLIHTYVPKVKILVICMPIVAALLSCVACNPFEDDIDFTITFLATISMCVTPYSLRNTSRSCVAIITEAVGFVLLAAALKNNTASMMTISVVALVLICSLPKLDWLNGKEENSKETVSIAVVTLASALLLLLMVEGTGVAEAFYVSSLGRPGLGSSSYVNQQCAGVFSDAKFIGRITDSYSEGVFSHRVLPLILALAGWLAAMPVILALVLMITSGIYLCCKIQSVRYYISISFMAVIAVQTVGYILTCCGSDQLLFPEMSPFLAGGSYVNTIFGIMLICILPSKPARVSELVTDEVNVEVG